MSSCHAWYVIFGLLLALCFSKSPEASSLSLLKHNASTFQTDAFEGERRIERQQHQREHRAVDELEILEYDKFCAAGAAGIVKLRLSTGPEVNYVKVSLKYGTDIASISNFNVPARLINETLELPFMVSLFEGHTSGYKLLIYSYSDPNNTYASRLASDSSSDDITITIETTTLTTTLTTTATTTETESTTTTLTTTATTTETESTTAKTLVSVPCVDQSASCGRWTGLGYCTGGGGWTEYMYNTCPESCRHICLAAPDSTVPPPTSSPTGAPHTQCLDSKTECSAWAQLGYCTSAYVESICQASCYVCRTPEPTPAPISQCMDLKPECSEWAAIGYCDTSPVWDQFMSINCPSSCYICPDDTTTLSPSFHPTSSPTVAPTVASPTSNPTNNPSSSSPTDSPSMSPTSNAPSVSPTTSSPTQTPSLIPTSTPTSNMPTTFPTYSPMTFSPSNAPSETPTKFPTMSPSQYPTTLNAYRLDVGALDELDAPTLTSFVATPGQALLCVSNDDVDTPVLTRDREVCLYTEPPGSQVEFGAHWGVLEASTVMSVPYKPAANLNVIIVDTEVGSDNPKARFACHTTDIDFSAFVGSGQCHVQLVSTTGSFLTGSCSASSSGRPCQISISIPTEFLTGADLMVRSGLDISYGQTHTNITTIPTIPITEERYKIDKDEGAAAAVKDTFVLLLPQKPLFPGESFKIKIVARADETISQAKFALDLTNASDIVEFTSTPVVELGSTTWELTAIEPQNGLQVFILVKKVDFVPQPGNNENQEVLEISLQVKDFVWESQIPEIDVSIALRVYEFGVGINPEVPPGGVTIPAFKGAWVHGSAIGWPRHDSSGVYVNEASAIKVKKNSPTGIIAKIDSGYGTLYNMAPLTGNVQRFTIVTHGMHRYGLLQRRLRKSECSCVGCGLEGAAIVSDDCKITLVATNRVGSADLQITVKNDDAITQLHIKVLAPKIPLAMSTSETLLGPLYLDTTLPLFNNGDCGSVVMASTSITATTTFSAGEGTVESNAVDVTSLVRSRLVSSDTLIATVDTKDATVTGGVSAGDVSIKVGNIGEVSVSVDGNHKWILNKTVTRHFAGFRMWAETPTSTLHMELDGLEMDRAREEGKHSIFGWTEFQLTSDSQHHTIVRDLSLDESVHYTVANSVVAVASNNNGSADYLEAVSNGNTSVHMTWDPGCGASLERNFSMLQVQFPTPVSVRFTNGETSSTVTQATLAHSNDAASLCGAVKEVSMKVGFAVEYPDYVDVWNKRSDPVTFEVIDAKLAYVAACVSDSTKQCVFPKAAVAGVTQVLAYMGSSRPTDTNSIAMLTVTVVKASGLSLTAKAYPRYPGSSEISILRPFGTASLTRSYEQAELSAILTLEPSGTKDVSSHAQSTFGSGDTNQVILTQRYISVVAETNADGQSLMSATFPGKNGEESTMWEASYVLKVDRSANNVVEIRDVKVVTSYTKRNKLTTLHATLGTEFVTLFTVVFADGFQVTHDTMASSKSGFGASFLTTGLFTYASSDATLVQMGTVGAPHNNLATPLKNGVTQAFVTVSSTNSAGQEVSGTSDGYFVNLKAREYEIDVASSTARVAEGYAVVPDSETTLTIKLFFTTGAIAIGALEMELMFDTSKLSFNEAVGGSDFDQNFGADGSEVPGVVKCGGVTTAYLQGENLHVATVTFTVKQNQGIGAFTGRVVSIADSAGKGGIVATPFDFGTVGEVEVVWSGRRRRQDVMRARTKLGRRNLNTSVTRHVRRGNGQCAPHYPVGDVNGDCVFDTTDALLTKQFLGISSNGNAAIMAFFDEKADNGIILGGQTSTAMDVDFNGQVMVADVSHMVFVKYNSRRFVLPATKRCVNGADLVQARVERANAQEYAADPANMYETQVFMLFTGLAPADPSGLESQFQNEQFSVDGHGRYRGLARATAIDDGTGLFGVMFDPLGYEYGVSVIHIVNKSPDGWVYGGFSVGDPLDTTNKLENWAFDIQFDLSFGIVVAGGDVAFPLTSQPFVVLGSVSTVSISVDITFKFSPFSLLDVCPTLTPTQFPTVTPTSNPTNVPTSSTPSHIPTVVPTHYPSTSSPTNVPNFNPTLAPTTSIPTKNPTTSPSTSLPSQSPTVSPSTSPSLSPTISSPTRTPSLHPTGSFPTATPSLLPTISPPTQSPSLHPTVSTPTISPSMLPTIPSPTTNPTSFPSSSSPSMSPSTSLPTVSPTASPSISLPTSNPTILPSSSSPSVHPSTTRPSSFPTLMPSLSLPTSFPSISPSTSSPTESPSDSPTVVPSTSTPTESPTKLPTLKPTTSPTSSTPSLAPTKFPTSSWPTQAPLITPSASPTTVPTQTAVIVIQDCVDDPVTWVDGDGNTCSVYADKGLCTKRQDLGWTVSLASIKNKTIAHTALSSCCACGGGIMTTLQSSKKAVDTNAALGYVIPVVVAVLVLFLFACLLFRNKKKSHLSRKHSEAATIKTNISAEGPYKTNNPTAMDDPWTKERAKDADWDYGVGPPISPQSPNFNPTNSYETPGEYFDKESALRPGNHQFSEAHTNYPPALDEICVVPSSGLKPIVEFPNTITSPFNDGQQQWTMSSSSTNERDYLAVTSVEGSTEAAESVYQDDLQ
eukprot:m.239325 g.239325  ORF g.239325 m.239325 type:complete len:2593 (+) comp33743_c0_seq1:121-7899(+)